MKINPPICYIGSKFRIMKYLPDFPNKINRYFEPFIGGASVYLKIRNEYNCNYFINDLDVDLYNLYTIFQDNLKYKKLIKKLNYLNTYQFTKKKSFYKLLKEFNKTQNIIDKTALYIYINKRSFNGNMAYNKNRICRARFVEIRKKRNIFNLKNFDLIKQLLGNNTEIYNLDYIKFLKKFNFKKNDFIFLDPPYFTKSVNTYYKSSFELKKYKELEKILRILTKKKVNWMLTLNYTIEFEKLFKKYNCKIVRKVSTISRQNTIEYELFITNYTN